MLLALRYSPDQIFPLHGWLYRPLVIALSSLYRPDLQLLGDAEMTIVHGLCR